MVESFGTHRERLSNDLDSFGTGVKRFGSGREVREYRG